ncbi:MAG: Smr/MutS family protein [Microcoleaceae cyanobacterium]
MKMTVGLAEIESLDGEKAQAPPARQKSEANKGSAKNTRNGTKPEAEKPEDRPVVRTSRNTIDLRGKRISEAEVELDRALGQILDFGAVWIIHGKGTGQLRRGVQEFLKTHPQIERYELAAQADGGAGVTVAYLK